MQFQIILLNKTYQKLEKIQLINNYLLQHRERNSSENSEKEHSCKNHMNHLSLNESKQQFTGLDEKRRKKSILTINRGGGQENIHNISCVSIQPRDSRFLDLTDVQKVKNVEFHLGQYMQENCSRIEEDQEDNLMNNIKNFFLKMRLKNWVKNIVGQTRCRMYRNLTYSQLNIIGDKAHDTNQYMVRQRDFIRDAQKKGFFYPIIQKIDQFIPVLHPKHIIMKISDMLMIVAIIFLFFSVSISVSFHIMIEEIVPPNSIQVCLCILFSNTIVRLNTGFQRLGTTVSKRDIIFQAYFHDHFLRDSLSFLSIILLLLFDHNVFGLSETNLDTKASLKLLIFAPFLLKLKNISTRLQKFEDKIISKKRTLQILQLSQLFFVIIFINHIMACIWIFNSKLSPNISTSWIVSMRAEEESIAYQYILAFYFSTVTMTSVGINIIKFPSFEMKKQWGYGDITAKNLSEFVISIFMVMISSGVFGFTLNQIGNIFTEFYSEEKEIKHKLNIINLHMEHKNVDHSLQTQIREYLEYIWKENNEQFTDESTAIIGQLNEDLKKELDHYQNKKFIEFLQNYFSEDLIQKALLIITEQKIKPHQIIQTQGSQEDICLYLIEKGRVQVYLEQFNPINNSSTSKEIKICNGKLFGKVLEEGQIFGITEFFNGEQKSLSIKALGFVNLLKISRSEFIKILHDFDIDLEKFHFIKDKQIFDNDQKNNGDSCYSCKSKEHTIVNCNYIHLVSEKQKIISKLNYRGYHKESEPTKLWRDSSNNILKRNSYRKQKRIEIFESEDHEFEEFLLMNEELLEKYEDQFLQFNFNYDYIKYFTFQNNDEDEDDSQYNLTKQVSNLNDISSIYQSCTINPYKTNRQSHCFNNNVMCAKCNCSNKIQADDCFKNLNVNTTLSPKADEKKKLPQNFESPKLKNPNIPGDISESEQKRKVPMNFEAITPNMIGDELSPSINRKKQFNKSTIFALNSNNDISPDNVERKRSLFMKNLTPLIISQSPMIMSSNNNNNMIESVYEPKPSHVSNESEQSKQQSDSKQSSQRYFNRKQRKNKSNSHYQQMISQQQMTNSARENIESGLTIAKDHHHIEKKYSNASSKGIQMDQFVSKGFDNQNHQFQLEQQMRQFQSSILKNLKDMLDQANQGAYNSKTSLSRFQEVSDFAGMQLIFQQFDKMRNYTIYFPLNNLNFLIATHHKKKFITKQQYLQLIQTTGKTKHNITNINSTNFYSPGLFSHNSMLKYKIDIKSNGLEKSSCKKTLTLKNINLQNSNHDNTPSNQNLFQNTRRISESFSPTMTLYQQQTNRADIQTPHQKTEKFNQTFLSQDNLPLHIQLKQEVSSTDSQAYFPIQSPNIRDDLSQNNTFINSKSIINCFAPGKNNKYFSDD